jgi:hypothetical protein
MAWMGFGYWALVHPGYVTTNAISVWLAMPGVPDPRRNVDPFHAAFSVAGH